MKFLLLIVVCLFTAIGLIGMGNNSLTEASVAVDATPTPTPPKRFYTETKPMPEELMYGMLFLQISALETKDTESSAQGETSTFKASFYQNTLGLQSSQFAAVNNATSNALAQIQPIEQQARQVIDQYRSQYPNGELRKKPIQQSTDKLQTLRSQNPIEPLPPIPAQLQQLQSQKNQVILNAKQSIRQAIGESEFAEFDAAVRTHAKKVLVPLNLGSRTPEPFPSPTPNN